MTEAISSSRLVVPDGGGVAADDGFGGVAVEDESIEAASESGEVAGGGGVCEGWLSEPSSAWRLKAGGSGREMTEG